MVYTELALRRQQFHVAPAMPALKYTTSVDIQKTSYKKPVTHVESHASAVSLLKRAENMISNHQFILFRLLVLFSILLFGILFGIRQLKLNQSITAFKINALKTHLFLKPLLLANYVHSPPSCSVFLRTLLFCLQQENKEKEKKNLPPATVNTKPCLGQ